MVEVNQSNLTGKNSEYSNLNSIEKETEFELYDLTVKYLDFDTKNPLCSEVKDEDYEMIDTTIKKTSRKRNQRNNYSKSKTKTKSKNNQKKNLNYSKTKTQSKRKSFQKEIGGSFQLCHGDPITGDRPAILCPAVT